VSNIYTGFIAKISYKEGEGKRGKWRLYSAKVEKEDGTEYDDWISFGFDKPDVKEGDYVKITTEEDAKGYQKVSKVEKPKNAPSKGGAQAASGASAHVAAPSGGKERSIHYQSARKDAIAVLDLLISQDALPITKAKEKAGQAKRYEEMIDLVDKLTVRYFHDTETQRILETVADEGAETHEAGELPQDAKDEQDE
jgi:hypothetical protein